MFTTQLIILSLIFCFFVILTGETQAVPEDTYVVHTEKYNSRAISAISDAVAVFITNYLNKMCKRRNTSPMTRKQLPLKISYPMTKEYPSPRLYGYDSFEPEESRRVLPDEPPRMMEELVFSEYIAPQLPQSRIYDYDWQADFIPENPDTYKPQPINFYIRPGMANVLAHKRLQPPIPPPQPEPQPQEFSFYNPWFIPHEREEYNYLVPFQKTQPIQYSTMLPPTQGPTITETIVHNKVFPPYYTQEVEMPPVQNARKNLRPKNDDMEQRFQAMLIIIKEIRNKLNQNENEHIDDNYKSKILVFLNNLEQQIENEKENPSSDEEDKENLIEGNKRTVLYIQKIINDLEDKQRQTTKIFVEQTTSGSRRLIDEEPAKEVKQTTENTSESEDEGPSQGSDDNEEYNSSGNSYISDDSSESDEKEDGIGREGMLKPMRKNSEESTKASEPEIPHKEETQILEATSIMGDTTTPSSHIEQDRRTFEEEPTKHEDENEENTENANTSTEFTNSHTENKEEQINDTGDQKKPEDNHRKELDVNETEEPEVNEMEEGVLREMNQPDVKKIDREDPEFGEMEEPEVEVKESEDNKVTEMSEPEVKKTEETEVPGINEIEPEVKEVDGSRRNSAEKPVDEQVNELDSKNNEDPEGKEMEETPIKEVEPEVKEEAILRDLKVPEGKEIEDLEDKKVEEPETKDPEFKEIPESNEIQNGKDFEPNLKDIEESSTMSTSDEDYSAESLESTRTKALPFLDIFSYNTGARLSPEKREELEKLRRIILHLYFHTKKQPDDYYKIGVVALKWFDTVSESPTDEDKITFLKYWIENNNLEDENLYDKLILLIKSPKKLNKEYNEVIHEQVKEMDNNEESGDIDEDVFRVGVIILKLQNVVNDNKYDYMDMIRRIIQKPVADYTDRDKEIISRLLLLAKSPAKLDKTFNKIRYEVLKNNSPINEEKMNMEQIEQVDADGSKLIVAIMRVPPKAYRKNKAIGSRETREKIIQKLLDDLHRKMNSTITETEDDDNNSKEDDDLLLKKIIIMDEDSKDGREARRTLTDDDEKKVHALVKSLVKDKLGTNKKLTAHPDAERNGVGKPNPMEVDSTKLYRTYFDTVAQTYVPGASEELPELTNQSPFVREIENLRENTHPMDSEIERTTILNFAESSDYTTHGYIITDLPSTTSPSLDETAQDKTQLMQESTDSTLSTLRRFLDIILHKSEIKEGPSKTYIENNQKTVITQKFGNSSETSEQEDSSNQVVDKSEGMSVYQEIEAPETTPDPDFEDMTTRTPLLKHLLRKLIAPLINYKPNRRNLDPLENETTSPNTEINQIVEDQEKRTPRSVENNTSNKIDGIFVNNESTFGEAESPVINISEKPLNHKNGADNTTTISVIKTTDNNKEEKNCNDEKKSSTTESNHINEPSTTTKDHKQNAKTKGHSSDCNNNSKHNLGHHSKSNEEELDLKAFERLRKALQKAELSILENGININKTNPNDNSNMKNEPLKSDVEKFWTILRYFMDPDTKFDDIRKR